MSEPEPVRLRQWRAYGSTVEINHTRDLSADEAEQARVGRAVRAYLVELAVEPRYDWSDAEQDIADAISDSMDMDWTSAMGARAVVEYLKKIGAVLP